MSNFQASRDRIDRARVHANAYIEAANTLFKKNPPTTLFDLKHDGASGGSGIAKFTFEKPFDNYLALELGEFFYQLRAALDGVFWEASVIVSSPKSPPNMSRIEFPIGKTAFDKSPLHAMPFPQELHAFIEQIQPYNIPKYTGTPEAGFLLSLKMIHDCARLDRHRHLSLMAALPYRSHGRFTCLPPFSIHSLEAIAADFLHGKCEFMRFGISGWNGIDEPEIHLEGHIDIHVSIKEIPVPLGGDVAEYLRMIAATAEWIVLEFEQAFI